MPKNQSIPNPFSQFMTLIYQAGFELDSDQRKQYGISPPPNYKHLRGVSADFVVEAGAMTDDQDLAEDREFRLFEEFFCSYDIRRVRRLEKIRSSLREADLMFHLDYECIYPTG